MPRIDVHQHLWTEALADALAQRTEHPFVRSDHGLTVVFIYFTLAYGLAAALPAR